MKRGPLVALVTVAALASGTAVSGIAGGSQTGVPECSAGMLNLELGPPVSPMTGEHADLFELRNRAVRTCVLYGHPRIGLRDGSVNLAFVYAREGQYVTRRKPQRVMVAPGHHAFFVVAKYRCDGEVLHTVTSISAWLPRRGGELSMRLHQGGAELDYCKPYAGDQPIDPGNRVQVSPVEASARAALPAA